MLDLLDDIEINKPAKGAYATTFNTQRELSLQRKNNLLNTTREKVSVQLDMGNSMFPKGAAIRKQPCMMTIIEESD